MEKLIKFDYIIKIKLISEEAKVALTKEHHGFEKWESLVNFDVTSYQRII